MMRLEELQGREQPSSERMEQRTGNEVVGTDETRKQELKTKTT